jgi:DNA polymerase elongation subunit (family B)
MDDIDISNISKGYRNVYYRNNSSGEGEIVLLGWDKDGNRDTFIFPFSPSAKYEVKEVTPNKTIFDTCVKVKNFKNSWERKKWLDSASDGINVIESFRPETEFLMNSFRQYALDDDFNIQPLRIHFIDCEIEVGDEFPKPEEAKYPINIITIYDTLKKKYFSWVLGRKVTNTFSDKSVIINSFSNEVEMLKDFVCWFSNNYPDVISGWNTYYFDITYIVRRIENILGDKTAKLMSPSGKYFIKQQKSFFNNTYITLEGISHLDLLILYRDKFYIEGALDGGYSLSNVCLHELNEDKIQYDGTIRDFYKRDFQKFFEYNIRAV